MDLLMSAAVLDASVLQQDTPRPSGARSHSSSSSSDVLVEVTPPDPDAAVGSREPIVRVIQEDTIRNWFGFRLTWVPPKRSGQSGAWQGTCPYHRKAATRTHCKKTLTAQSSTEDGVLEALQRMKAWCVAAARTDRHRTHMKLAVQATDLTEDQLDEAARALQLSHGELEVLPDDELDKQVAEAKAIAKPRARKGARRAS